MQDIIQDDDKNVFVSGVVDTIILVLMFFNKDILGI